MAEYIDTEKIEYPYMTMSMWGLNSGDCHAYNEGVKAVEDRISAMPAADVVEVVRCKDCKYSKYKPIIGRLEEGEQTALLYCTMFVNGQHIYKYDFCSYGERKADNV